MTINFLGVLLGGSILFYKSDPLKMAKTTKPLTNTEVKQAKPKEKPYKLFDGAGLVLKVRVNGSCSCIRNRLLQSVLN